MKLLVDTIVDIVQVNVTALLNSNLPLFLSRLCSLDYQLYSLDYQCGDRPSVWMKNERADSGRRHSE